MYQLFAYKQENFGKGECSQYETARGPKSIEARAEKCRSQGGKVSKRGPKRIEECYNMG